jgi:hypothetical protein
MWTHINKVGIQKHPKQKSAKDSKQKIKENRHKDIKELTNYSFN